MNLSLLGKNALVGGGSQGIGKAAAVELALLGANVTLISRTESSLIDALQGLDCSQGQQHSYIVADYAHPLEVQAAVNTWLQTHKVAHIVINNTGGPAGGVVHGADYEQFVDAFNRHLICNQLIAQAVLEGMKSAGYGRIINVISTSVKQPLDNLGVSNTIRGAVANWAKTLANEVGRWGITVNNVLPGATRTQRLESIMSNNAGKQQRSVADIEEDMKEEIPLKRIGEPQEVGAVIAFLASPAAAYVNGINLPVDGGRTKCL